MSDFEFDAPLPYDETIAEEGVAFDVNLSGRDYGSFHCVYLDGFSKKYERLEKQFEARHSKAIRTGKIKKNTIPYAKLFFVENILTGWSGVTAKGKEVPFSVEAATAYFNGPAGDHIYGALFVQFSDPKNFVGEEFYANDADEAEKN